MATKKCGKLITITGPSGAGRGSVVAMLQKNDANFVEPTGVTSRMPRPGEVEGKHYFFVTEEQFKEGIENNSFLFWSQHARSFYGIYKDTVSQLIDEGKNVILEIALGEDLNAIKRLYPDMISIYIIPTDANSMIRRLIAREHNDMDRVQGRINVYEAEAYAALKTDAILVNEYPEDTAATIVNIIDDTAVQKKYYDECVELVVELKKALKEYKVGSRFIIKDGCLQKYKEKPGTLYTVEIPEGITSIGAGAFRWCEYLSEVRIPQSIVDIGGGAFQGCECLKSIQLPRNMKHISEETFMDCGLNSIRIPRGIETIENGAFRGCSELTRIQIPDSVTTIGEEAFSGCSSLSEISLPENIDQIGQYAFSLCKSITTFAIPRKLSFIPVGMFFKCYNLYDIHIPNTIEEIGDQAFDTCRRLANIVIPAATVRIGAWSFAGCTELRNVFFANDAVEIDEHAFENCTSLSRINLPRKASEIRKGTFEGCTSLEDVVFPMHIKTIGKNAFKGCYQLKHVVIPVGVTTIKQGAFAECRGLRCIEIPESVVSIEDHAFDGCYAVKIRAVPGSVAERYAKENGIDIENTAQSLGEEILSAIKNVGKDVKTVGDEVRTIDRKIDLLRGFIENDLCSAITTARKKVQSGTENDEDAVTEFIEKTSAYINHMMSSPDTLVEQETDHLKRLFGKSWNLLLPESQASLISAGVLWKSCASITKPGFDFSGVIISATSALEMELKHIFYSNFQDFLEQHYGTPDIRKAEQTLQNWPEILLDKKKGLEKGNYFTLGKLPYILGKPEKTTSPKKEKLLQTRLEEYLSTIVIDIYSGDPIGAFYRENNPDCIVNRCMFINGEYRIKAAHTDVIEREQADDCYQQVIVGKVDALKHTAHVTGLIIELYGMLK